MITRRSFKSVENFASIFSSATDKDNMPPTPNRSSTSNLTISTTSSATSPVNNERKLTRLAGLWRWLAILLLVGVALYTFLDDGEVEASQRIVRGGHEEKRELTIVLNTFKRYDLMNKAINYYSKCDCVKYIYIIWSEETPPSQSLLSRFTETDVPRVIFNIQKEDSLNNRFKPLPSPHTDAIFSVDDDMRVPCDELALALEVWRSSSDSLVGFMPRIHLRGGPDGLLQYRCWWKVWWTGAYSIILTKAAILHHKFFHAYFDQMPKAIHTLVDDRRNCEDIAMQFLMSNITSLPPIYVKGHLGDKGALGGISTSHNVIKAGHMIQRDDCLNELVKIYGHNPLKRAHYFIDAANNRWNSAPSTWWEYISSDLWKW